MADRPNPNAENPETPDHRRKPVPTDPRFYIPGAAVQPMIDPVTGAVLKPGDKPAPSPAPAPAPAPKPSGT